MIVGFQSLGSILLGYGLVFGLTGLYALYTVRRSANSCPAAAISRHRVASSSSRCLRIPLHRPRFVSGSVVVRASKSSCLLAWPTQSLGWVST